MASAASLPEPRVLASTKQHLFPDDGAVNAYAVVDTQFATTEWLSGQPVPASVRARLAPFNHVRVGSGFPDLVGVRSLDADFLAVERFGDRPPLVAIEAKGHTEAGTVDVERGVIQAYDRLHGANAAYVAAPGDAVSRSDRTLARELNVGVIGVETDGTVTPLEKPRVVGNRTADSARTGAAFLGLIDERPNGIELTPLGRDVVRFALDRYDSVESALYAFEDWVGSRTRFCELAPAWGSMVRRVIWAYPATQLLVEELQTMHDDGSTDPSLVDLVEWLSTQHPAFTVELFIRGTDDARRRALTSDGQLRVESLENGDIFHSSTVFQLKAMLYHAGVLTERGAEPSRLDPTIDLWKLRRPL